MILNKLEEADTGGADDDDDAVSIKSAATKRGEWSVTRMQRVMLIASECSQDTRL